MQAAVGLQRVGRGFLARHMIAEWNVNATQCQRLVRGHSARLLVTELRHRKQVHESRTAAATVLQHNIMAAINNRRFKRSVREAGDMRRLHVAIAAKRKEDELLGKRVMSLKQEVELAEQMQKCARHIQATVIRFMQARFGKPPMKGTDPRLVKRHSKRKLGRRRSSRTSRRRKSTSRSPVADSVASGGASTRSQKRRGSRAGLSTTRRTSGGARRGSGAGLASARRTSGTGRRGSGAGMGGARRNSNAGRRKSNAGFEPAGVR